MHPDLLFSMFELAFASRPNQPIRSQASLLAKNHLQQHFIIVTTVRTLSKYFTKTPTPLSDLSISAFALLPFHITVEHGVRRGEQRLLNSNSPHLDRVCE
jgi:hypothetical protein